MLSSSSAQRTVFLKRAFVLCIASFALHRSVNGATEFNYKLQGQDWTGTCSTGVKQSPVDVSLTTATVPSYDTVINDAGVYTGYTVAQNGHSIQVTPKATTADFVTIAGDKYNLEQYHFHAKSEHRLGSSQKDMEAHLLFRSAADSTKLSVVAFLFEGAAAGSEGLTDIPAITALSKLGLTTEASSVESTDQNLNILSDLLNAVESAKTLLVTYDGSLTTPPCTESVRWYVFGTPINLDETAVMKPLVDALKYTGTKGNYRDNQYATSTEVTQYLTTYGRQQTAFAHSSTLSTVCKVLVLVCTSLLFV